MPRPVDSPCVIGRIRFRNGEFETCPDWVATMDEPGSPLRSSENKRRPWVPSQCQLAAKVQIVSRLKSQHQRPQPKPMACRDKIRAVEESTPSAVYEIRAQWDDEAGVWVAASDHVPGLVVEAGSPKVLVQKLRSLIPELLELNGVVSDRTASFHVLYQHEDSGVLTF